MAAQLRRIPPPLIHYISVICDSYSRNCPCTNKSSETMMPHRYFTSKRVEHRFVVGVNTARAHCGSRVCCTVTAFLEPAKSTHGLHATTRRRRKNVGRAIAASLPLLQSRLIKMAAVVSSGLTAWRRSKRAKKLGLSLPNSWRKFIQPCVKSLFDSSMPLTFNLPLVTDFSHKIPKGPGRVRRHWTTLSSPRGRVAGRKVKLVVKLRDT